MPEPSGVPAFKTLSPTMRVDVLVSDWRSELDPALSQEQKETELYGKVWEAYQEGDFGFGLWLWHESDRLQNAFNGSVREVTRVVGPGRFFGFSHRKAVAEKVPLDKVYRPRKGDMSTPRTDAIVLPHYQLLCVYLINARGGDARSKALLEISLGEMDEKRRADRFLPHFETFRRLLERPAAPAGETPPAATPPTPPAPEPTPAPAAADAAPPKARRRAKQSS
jgi:pyruvate/2-oxoglutarate dehydrogenase complex dihydrolipoamide acyltransferase (E2) component